MAQDTKPESGSRVARANRARTAKEVVQKSASTNRKRTPPTRQDAKPESSAAVSHAEAELHSKDAGLPESGSTARRGGRSRRAESPAPAPDAEAPGTEAPVGTDAAVEHPETANPSPAADETQGEPSLESAAPSTDSAVEFAIKPQVLKAGLSAVVAALPLRQTLPVLQNVLLESDGEDHLRMTATDLDTTVTRRVPATVSTPGAVLLMGRKLLEIAKEIPDSCMLDVRLAGSTLLLQCSETRTRYRLPTIPADEFPAPPSIPWEEGSVAVPGEVMALLIERTAFAASTEETRPILNGVLWVLGDGELGMVATDGHRLARTRVPVTEAVAREGCILHPKALAMVARLPADRETVSVAFAQNHVGFRGDGWEILTRTFEGPYPDYRRVLPQDNDKVLVADRGALAAAVRRMAILASDQTHRIRMSLGTELLMMRISVETPELGEAHEDVAVDYQGDPLEIGFNAQYLLEVLRYLPPGDVRMTFRAPERAATLSPVQDEAGARSETVLMPLRLV